jgi:fumarate hydratase class II
MGNDTTITVAGSNGQFELNVFKPVMISALLQSATLIADACRAFNDFCVAGIEPIRNRIAENLRNSLMLVTALNNHIGYENAARIANEAYTGNLTLKEAALKLRLLTEEEYDRWVVPAEMIRPKRRIK